MVVTAIGLDFLFFGQKLHTGLYYMKQESEDAGEVVRIHMPTCVLAVGLFVDAKRTEIARSFSYRTVVASLFEHYSGNKDVLIDAARKRGVSIEQVLIQYHGVAESNTEQQHQYCKNSVICLKK